MQTLEEQFVLDTTLVTCAWILLVYSSLSVNFVFNHIFILGMSLPQCLTLLMLDTDQKKDINSMRVNDVRWR